MRINYVEKTGLHIRVGVMEIPIRTEDTDLDEFVRSELGLIETAWDVNRTLQDTAELSYERPS